jgi:hypothetical protein
MLADIRTLYIVLCKHFVVRMRLLMFSLLDKEHFECY